ncbi:Cys-Gln thioester bond-forming surface protein [Lentzea sp. NPDC051213]|uniref:Cys-Gln thioester bond-forming surface protein n=1 Tax=Lentzea sp. NPDC051213 TaxID=3364126 RepID=UPI00379135D3
MASGLRIGTALLGATAVLAFTALPAYADVKITPDRGGQEKGHDVVLKPVGNISDPNELKQDTSVIKLRIEDDEKRSTVLTYCVELPTPLEDGDVLKEAPWGTHPNKKSKFPQNAGKVLWILQNSYPGQSMAEVKKAFGDQFDKEETIAATQAAIWHFSDEAELDPDKTDADVVKLYERLVKDAVTNEIKEQPKPTLEIDPASKSGKSGEKIGPFKVTTTASEVKLTADLPQGVTITDAQGNPLAVQKKGQELAVQGTGEKVTEFFVNVPANAPNGNATFNLSAEAEIAIGRLFVAHNKKQDDKAQSLVVAQPQKAKVEKEAKADWKLEVKPSEPTTPSSTVPTVPSETPTTSSTPNNPAPGGSGDDDLASTGASIMWPLLGGLALVGAGVGALFVVRRKKAGA